jgi:hypothetical protein
MTRLAYQLEELDLAPCDEAADLIRQMAEQEQKPGAWRYRGEPWFDGSKWHEKNEVTTSEQVARFQDSSCVPLYAAPPAPQPDDTALSRYHADTDGCEPDTPKERLRAFCSVAMAGQDWLDAESFFDALPDDTALLRQALTLLIRYRNGTPIGHQPHMTAHEADDAIAALRARLDGAPQPDDTTLLRQARLPEGEKK